LKNKRGIIIFAVIIFILSLGWVYSSSLRRQNIEGVHNLNAVTFITVDKFNQYELDNSLTWMKYDAEKDILEARLSDDAMIKYNMSGSPVVYLGDVSNLIKDKKLLGNSAIAQVEEDTKIYQFKPVMTGIIVLVLVLVGIFLFRLIRDIFKDIFTKTTPVAAPQSETPQTAPKYRVVTDTGIKLADVKGHDEIRADLEFIVKFLKNPQKYKEVGAEIPKGILFFGEPGTGKTMIAKAIANEAGIPFIPTCGSDFVEKYVGVGAQRIRELFETARKHKECIIFIDEIDAIGKTRGKSENSELDSSLNALLVEMDGFKSTGHVLVIASTNRRDMLDDALLRPGRFDKHIKVGLPDYTGRLEILKLYAKNKKLSKEVVLEKIAKLTRGFSGADLANLLNEAAMLTAFRDKNKTTMQEIDDAHFRVLTKGEKKNNYERSYSDTELTAWHEAGHAIVSRLIAQQKVNKVTIVPSTSDTGGVTFMSPKEGMYLSKLDIENMIKVAYGGRAAEQLLLGAERHVTTGALNDIEIATKYIIAMISDYGMSEKFGLLNLNILNASKSPVVLDEARTVATKLYNETVDFLKQHELLLKDLANKLIETETLVEDELDQMFMIYLNKGYEEN
jgi:cell division protease FtsH